MKILKAGTILIILNNQKIALVVREKLHDYTFPKGHLEEFETLEELYKRIKPALITKKNEMHRDGYIYIKEEDIWNYLKEIKY